MVYRESRGGCLVSQKGVEHTSIADQWADSYNPSSSHSTVETP